MFSSGGNRERFEAAILPNMDAAYNLALWLTRNDGDAQDVVQDAALRAFRFIEQFDGREPRAWFLTIVRNAFYSWVRKNRPEEVHEPLDPETHDLESAAPTPDLETFRNLDRKRLWDAMGELPLDFREALVLREFEGMSYREIAELAAVPIGTVMSRLSRARKQLMEILVRQRGKGATR